MFFRLLAQGAAEVPAMLPITSILLVYGSLFILAGGIYYVLWRRKRGGPGKGTGRGEQIHLEATRSLGSRQFLMVVRVDHERFLLGSSTAGIRSLGKLENLPQAETVDASRWASNTTEANP